MSTSGGSGGGGAVSSVFARTGAVVATTGDYTAAQVHAVASTVVVLGEGSPATVTPAAIGQLYIDRTGGALYLAQSTTTGDWVCLGGNAVDESNTYVNTVNTSLGGPSASIGDGTGDILSLTAGTVQMYANGDEALNLTSTQVQLYQPLSSAVVASVTNPTISSGVKFQC